MSCERENERGRVRAAFIAAALIFAAGAVSAAYMFLRNVGSEVEVISGSRVLYTLDLAKEPDRTITVEYEGRRNVIKIEDHDIFVTEADCPDHTCIRTGRLSRAGGPVVCLPNRLVIRYKNSRGDTDAAA